MQEATCFVATSYVVVRIQACRPRSETFNYFDIVYVLTRGGPLNATAIFPTRIYDLGFGQFRFGEAATYGAVSVVVLVLIVAVLFLLLRRPGGIVRTS